MKKYLILILIFSSLFLPLVSAADYVRNADESISVSIGIRFIIPLSINLENFEILSTESYIPRGKLSLKPENCENQTTISINNKTIELTCKEENEVYVNFKGKNWFYPLDRYVAHISSLESESRISLENSGRLGQILDAEVIKSKEGSQIILYRSPSQKTYTFLSFFMVLAFSLLGIFLKKYNESAKTFCELVAGMFFVGSFLASFSPMKLFNISFFVMFFITLAILLGSKKITNLFRKFRRKKKIPSRLKRSKFSLKFF